jgi:hypothetical protein
MELYSMSSGTGTEIGAFSTLFTLVTGGLSEDGEEMQQVNSPHSFQHNAIKNSISTLTPQREIDAIICLKKDIIDRIAQLDPDDPFWNEQKDHLVAHGILTKKGKSIHYEPSKRSLIYYINPVQTVLFLRKYRRI